MEITKREGNRLSFYSEEHSFSNTLGVLIVSILMLIFGFYVTNKSLPRQRVLNCTRTESTLVYCQVKDNFIIIAVLSWVQYSSNSG
jgi:dolichol kinase